MSRPRVTQAKAKKKKPLPEGTDLTGRLLIAMPSMQDQRFEKSVIFLCAHGEGGSMGLVINKPLGSHNLRGIMAQLGLMSNPSTLMVRLLDGGPVEHHRGFVLHSGDYLRDDSVMIEENIALTASVDILRALAEGYGPRQAILSLGYAGWAPGQLEAEIQANGWLIAPATEDILFGDHDDTKWERAIASLGFSPAFLSSTSGRA